MTVGVRIGEEKEIPLDWNVRFTSFAEYMNCASCVNVATLGPVGTSSEAAVNYLLSIMGKEGNCLLFSSYEEACNSVVDGLSNVLVVANAYERIDKIYMSPDLQFLYSFVFETPLYGVAKKPFNGLPENSRLLIATHHAPSSLLPWFLSDYDIDYDVMYVSSTSEAAAKVQKGEVDLCITNANAAEQYDVEFISPTRTILMLWSVFIRKEG